ncbi:hypothetical protein MD484_g2812, partial [Candolleomyces efflorescens]
MASAPTRRSKRGLSVGNTDLSSSNAPSQQTTAAPPSKRTRAEIQRSAAEKQNAKVKEVADQVADLEKREAAGVKAIAAIEDRVREEQWKMQLYAERPDIPTFAAYKPPSPARASSELPMDTDEPGDEDEDGLDKPVDTDSDGLGLGEDQHDDTSDDEYSPPKEGDDEDLDLDGPIDIEKLKDAYRKAKVDLARKRKEQQAKGMLRSQVNEHRKLQPVAPVTMRKQMKEDLDKRGEVVKEKKDGGTRKKLAPEGFKKDWNHPTAPAKSRPVSSEPTATVAAPTRHSKTSTSTSKSSAPIPASGHSNTPKQANALDDESPSLVNSARESKATVLSQRDGTSKMGLSVKKGKISAGLKASAIPRKHNYSTKDLPLDGVEDGVTRWREEAIPIVLAWASTLSDPFSVSSSPFFESVVKQAWEDVFAPEEVEFSGEILHVAGAAMRTWRSTIGKAALKLLADHFKQPEFANKEARAMFVREQLDDMRYVYEDPINKRRAYRAPLLLQIFAVHQNEVQDTDVTYGPAVGGLAFAATALERALKYWSGGILADYRANFTRAPWVTTLNKHVGTIKTLQKGHWDKIEAAMKPFVTAASPRMALDSVDNNDTGDIFINISDLDDD